MKTILPYSHTLTYQYQITKKYAADLFKNLILKESLQKKLYRGIKNIFLQ